MSAYRTGNFKLLESTKLGSGWEQQFVVIRNNEVYLRIVGDGTNYRVMTATAGEDASGAMPCRNQKRLQEAAAQLARKYEWVEDTKLDQQGRAYIIPFELSQSEEDSDEVFTEEVNEMVGKFFDFYDELKSVAAK